MQVQKVNIFSFDCRKKVKKSDCDKNPVFKGYKEVMTKTVKRDLQDVFAVSSAFGQLYKELKSSYGVIKSPELAVLEDNGFRYINTFMEKICAPIAKIPSPLRDLVFKTENENITLLEKDGVGSLTMFNFGKIGFLNSIFNSQDARNDIKFLFSTPNQESFEVGTTKGGGLVVEQIYHTSWIKSEFGMINRRTKKTGTFDTTPPIW